MKRTVLIAISFLVVLFFSFFLVGGALKLMPTDLWPDGLLGLVSFSASILLAISLLTGFKGALSLWIPNLRPSIGRINLSLVLLGFVLIFAASVALHPVVSLFSKDWIDPINTLMSNGLWAMISAVVVAPILEEYLIRGIVQNSIQRASGKVWVGILVSSVLFGVIHLIPQQVLLATVSGVILGAIYAATRSLPTVVLIHMLVNGTAFLEFLFLGEDFDAVRTLFPSSIGYGLAVGTAWAVLAGTGWWAVRKIGKK